MKRATVAQFVTLIIASAGAIAHAQPDPQHDPTTPTEPATAEPAEPAEPAAAAPVPPADGTTEDPFAEDDAPSGEPTDYRDDYAPRIRPTEDPPATLPPDGADDLPVMSPDLPIACLEDRDGHLWRVQCGLVDGAKACVYAPDAIIGADGGWGGALERSTSCGDVGSFITADLTRGGATMVRGIADAPSGWRRDARGRVFQVEFDLHKRLYVGVDWVPGRDRDGGTAIDQLGINVSGVEFEVFRGEGDDATRHRVAFLRGEVMLAPFEADVTAFHYDLSRRTADPLFHITTFFGTPRRHDIDAHLGAWVEAGRATMRDDAQGRREVLWRYGTAHLTWDLLRSADLYSYLRVRGGAGVERVTVAGAFDEQRDALTPGGAIEGDWTLDQNGLNHLAMKASWEHPVPLQRTLPGGLGNRIELGASYERILIALNDQPITLRFAAEADYRSDQPDRPHGWDLRGIAGLRFNFWAPAR